MSLENSCQGWQSVRRGVTACLENTEKQIESSDKLTPCSNNMLSPLSVSVDDIVYNKLIEMKTVSGSTKENGDVDMERVNNPLRKWPYIHLNYRTLCKLL